MFPGDTGPAGLGLPASQTVAAGLRTAAKLLDSRPTRQDRETTPEMTSTRKRTRPWTFGLCAALVAAGFAGTLACGGGSASEPIPEHPDFSGTWVINLELSDRPDDQLRPREGDRPAGARPEPRRAGPGLGALLQSFVAFRIVDEDSTVTLISAGGDRRVVRPDGAERQSRLEGLGNITVKTRWRGDRLVVERRLDSGARITETYALAAEGRRLYVTTKISGIPRTIEFRRVYDPGQEGI